MKYKLIKCKQRKGDSCVRFKVKVKQRGVKIEIYIDTINGGFMITYCKREVSSFLDIYEEAQIINEFISDLEDFPEEEQKKLVQEARKLVK